MRRRWPSSSAGRIGPTGYWPSSARRVPARAIWRRSGPSAPERGFCLRARSRNLACRLRALPVAELGPPDDNLLRAVLIKLFADRQLAVDENLIGYLAARIERSIAAARAAVATLDQASLRLQRPVNRALAVATLRGLEP